MRTLLVAIGLCFGASIAYAKDDAYWRGAIERWGRPANFYSLAWIAPGQTAVCHAYYNSSVPAVRTYAVPNYHWAMPNIAATTADIAWHQFNSQPFMGNDFNGWVIVPYANDGIDRAVVYTHWKGERELHLLVKDDQPLLSTLNRAIFEQGQTSPSFVQLKLAVPLDAKAQEIYARVVDGFIHPIFVKLLNRYYLSLNVEGPESGRWGALQPTGWLFWQSRRFMTLIELDSQGRGRAICILRARYWLRFETK